jgi:hypothetical protein
MKVVHNKEFRPKEDVFKSWLVLRKRHHIKNSIREEPTGRPIWSPLLAALTAAHQLAHIRSASSAASTKAVRHVAATAQLRSFNGSLKIM